MLNTPLSHEAGCSIIKEAFVKGVTFFDTSDVYGYNKHDNEIMIGKVQFFSFQSSYLIYQRQGLCNKLKYVLTKCIMFD